MLKVNQANFEQEVLNAGGPVFEATAEEFEGKVKFVKVNIDESPEIAEKYFVMSIPTLKLVDGEELKGNYVGAMSQDDLEDWVNDRI